MAPPPQRNPHHSTPRFGTPERPRPYLATLFVLLVLGLLPGTAVQWYAISVDSGMYSRIASAMVHIASFVAPFGTVHRDGGAAGRAVVDAGRDLPLRRQLRLITWGRWAIVYLTTTVVAVPALVADAHGHAIAFPALTLCLITGHALWTVPLARQRLRHAPPMILLVTLAILLGLLTGGINQHGYWIDDPWFWAGAALTAVLLLRVFRSRLAAWRHARRRRRTDLLK